MMDWLISFGLLCAFGLVCFLVGYFLRRKQIKILQEEIRILRELTDNYQQRNARNILNKSTR